MKKLILIALCFGLMTIGSAGSASAYSQTLLIPQLVEAGNTAFWHFDIPSDFDPSIDKVNSAWLGISAITMGGDKVAVEGTHVGTLNTSTPWWQFNSTTFDLNINNVIANYLPSDRELYVSVLAVNTIALGASAFNLDYENIYPQDPGGGSAPVPEPATLLLLGSGLSGLAFWGKRRRIVEP